jgi:hypothetical protein
LIALRLSYAARSARRAFPAAVLRNFFAAVEVLRAAFFVRRAVARIRVLTRRAAFLARCFGRAFDTLRSAVWTSSLDVLASRPRVAPIAVATSVNKPSLCVLIVVSWKWLVGSQAAHQKKYQQNDEHEADASTRVVAPASAVRPRRNAAYQSQQQHDKKNQHHDGVLLFSISTSRQHV